MFNKKQRINNKEFKEIFKTGKTKNTPHFFCKFLKDENIENTKFSVVVPKKQIKSAVKRNFLKRKIYHFIKEVIYKKTLPYSIIFISKKGTGDISNIEIKKEVDLIIKSLI